MKYTFLTVKVFYERTISILLVLILLYNITLEFRNEDYISLFYWLLFNMHYLFGSCVMRMKENFTVGYNSCRSLTWNTPGCFHIVHSFSKNRNSWMLMLQGIFQINDLQNFSKDTLNITLTRKSNILIGCKPKKILKKNINLRSVNVFNEYMW